MAIGRRTKVLLIYNSAVVRKVLPDARIDRLTF